MIWSEDPLTIAGNQIRIPFAVHDPDDNLPWPVRYRLDVGAWKSIDSNCDTVSESDWVCHVFISTVGLSEGSHQLDAQVADGDNWTNEQSMYFNMPKQSTPETENEQSGPGTNSADGIFSIWFVLIATGITIVIIAGLYMLVALSREDEDLLSEEELEELMNL